MALLLLAGKMQDRGRCCSEFVVFNLCLAGLRSFRLDMIFQSFFGYTAEQTSMNKRVSKNYLAPRVSVLIEISFQKIIIVHSMEKK